MAEIPEDKTRKNVLMSVFLTIFLDLVGFGMFIPIIPLIARHFGASDAAAVSVASLYSLGTLLAVALLGRLSDRYGRKKILMASIVISAFSQLLTAFATNFGFLSVVRFIAGMASGNIAVAQACISDVSRPQERGRSMAVIGMAFGLGFSIGPAFGALMSYLFPDSALMSIGLASAFLNLVNFFFVVRRLPETNAKHAEPSMKAFVLSIREQSDAGHRAETGKFWLDFQLITRHTAFRIMLLLSFLQVFAFVGVESILSLVLADSFHIQEQKQQYLYFMAIGLMLVVVNGGLTRPLIKRWGEVRTLNFGQSLLTLSMITLPFFAPSSLWLAISLALLALGSGLSNPSLSSLTSRLAPADMQGFALGTAQTLGALARVVGPAVFGFLYQFLQGARSLYVSSSFMLLGGMIAFWGLRETARKFRAQASS